MKIKKLLALIFLLSLIVITINAAYPDLDEYVESKSWERIHRVSKGETLWDIARELDAEHDTRFIIAAIKKVDDIGSMITINQKLILPSN